MFRTEHPILILQLYAAICMLCLGLIWTEQTQAIRRKSARHNRLFSLSGCGCTAIGSDLAYLQEVLPLMEEDVVKLVHSCNLDFIAVP